MTNVQCNNDVQHYIKGYIKTIFFNKRKEWEHEQEYRILNRFNGNECEEYLPFYNSLKYIILQNSRTINANESLRKLLGIPKLDRIELFDNSNLFGNYNVSGMVVYVNGKESKNDYRKYKIHVDKNDDYGTMREVLYRRYFRVLSDNLVRPDLIIVDALTKIDTDGIAYRSIVKGDAKCYSISAASIIAKVTRDRIMRQWDEVYPQYGFAKHKGYGTVEHITAIKEYGLCPLHRLSFVKNIVK